MDEFWKFITRKPILVVGVSTIAFVGGVVIGYKTADKRLRQYYADAANEEIIAAREHYNSSFHVETPVERRMREGKEVWEEQQKQWADVAEERTQVEEVVVVVFNYEEEMKTRSSNHPYIVSEDEYSEDSEDRVCWTFYEGSDTLADDKDEPIDLEDYAGRANLRFGYGSSDPNVVFIRNEKYDLWAEITKMPQTWEEMQENDNSYVGGDY
jgi:hypothetical protein